MKPDMVMVAFRGTPSQSPTPQYRVHRVTHFPLFSSYIFLFHVRTGECTDITRGLPFCEQNAVLDRLKIDVEVSSSDGTCSAFAFNDKPGNRVRLMENWCASAAAHHNAGPLRYRASVGSSRGARGRGGRRCGYNAMILLVFLLFSSLAPTRPLELVALVCYIVCVQFKRKIRDIGRPILSCLLCFTRWRVDHR